MAHKNWNMVQSFIVLIHIPKYKKKFSKWLMCWWQRIPWLCGLCSVNTWNMWNSLYVLICLSMLHTLQFAHGSTQTGCSSFLSSSDRGKYSLLQALHPWWIAERSLNLFSWGFSEVRYLVAAWGPLGISPQSCDGSYFALQSPWSTATESGVLTR